MDKLAPGVVFDQTTESFRDLPDVSSPPGPTRSKMEPLRIADPRGLLEKSFGTKDGGPGKEILLMVVSFSSSCLVNTKESEMTSFPCLAWRKRIELTPPTAALTIIDRWKMEVTKMLPSVPV